MNQPHSEHARRSAEFAQAMREVRNRRTILQGIGFLLIGPFAVHILAKRASSTTEWLTVFAVATGVVAALLWSLRRPSIWKFPRAEGTTPPRWLEHLERPVDRDLNESQNGGELHDRWLDG